MLFPPLKSGFLSIDFTFYNVNSASEYFSCILKFGIGFAFLLISPLAHHVDFDLTTSIFVLLFYADIISSFLKRTEYCLNSSPYFFLIVEKLLLLVCLLLFLSFFLTK